MTYLFLSIFSSASLVLLFKAFDRLRVNTVQAIVVNYFVASGLGFWMVEEPGFATLPDKPWFNVSLLVGTLFIIMFYLIALTAQKISVSASAVAQKMSVVIPVVVAIILYDETLNFLKGAGVILALVGVYLTSRRSGKVHIDRQWVVVLPLVVFLGGGFLDATMNYVERFLLNAGEKNTERLLYVSTLFFVAAALGVLLLLFRYAIGQARPFSYRSMLGGVVLGLPNFCSIYFLLRTLDARFLEDSAVFPINNMGIVTVSSLGAVLLFREHLSTANKIGVGLSLLAIAMIAYS